MKSARRTPQDPMQTVWVLLAVLCRACMAVIGVVGVAMDTLRPPAYAGAFAVHAALVACDAFTILAPLLRWRWLPLLAGVLTMIAHYVVSYGHHPSVWDPWYLGVSVLFLLLPRAEVPKPPAADHGMRPRVS